MSRRFARCEGLIHELACRRRHRIRCRDGRQLRAPRRHVLLKYYGVGIVTGWLIPVWETTTFTLTSWPLMFMVKVDSW